MLTVACLLHHLANIIGFVKDQKSLFRTMRILMERVECRNHFWENIFGMYQGWFIASVEQQLFFYLQKDD